ncbi:alpha/beta fold hydrolase [Rossellomorea aquimaris]|jgi:pimeloyl-ACP methyl ester carboxylesterase|uniref:Alpha/beta hydrolase n=1 Tax=Rossellomorea aquimaris TaxID=189382 RepID=A0A5D4TYQ9_9BACI|nr:alpha/beta hydrolase [Rossellomorea aquimaris]TYS80159.1 alpha/beta hydrolase [Rossellomorea aquimaris]TYS85542.1 alpha/beta hydrolase [Rossellomorea aquimaris]
MQVITVQLKKVKLGNGETLAYRERSGGHIPLVLIHGNMTSSKHWDIVLDRMDECYKIYAVDMRGFGESSYHRGIASIKDLSDDIKDWVDGLGLRDFSMAGWSTGGAVAMQFVIDYPGVCKNLILLASASTRGYPFFGTKADGTPDLGNRLRTMEEVMMDSGKTVPVQAAYDGNDREFLRALWNALIYSHNQPEEDRYEEYIDDMRTQRNLAHIYQALNMFNISDVYNGLVEGTDQAASISIPVLVLRGDRDYVITKEMTEEIVEDIGENATFVELKNSGHSPLIDDVDQLLHTMTSFLQMKEEPA